MDDEDPPGLEELVVTILWAIFWSSEITNNALCA